MRMRSAAESGPSVKRCKGTPHIGCPELLQGSLFRMVLRQSRISCDGSFPCGGAVGFRNGLSLQMQTAERPAHQTQSTDEGATQTNWITEKQIHEVKCEKLQHGIRASLQTQSQEQDNFCCPSPLCPTLGLAGKVVFLCDHDGDGSLGFVLDNYNRSASEGGDGRCRKIGP